MTTAVQNTPDLWRATFPLLEHDGNKYDRGHGLIYGGLVMTGASRLAARAAQRVGAGVVTLAAPEAALRIYAESMESVMVRSADTVEEWAGLFDAPKKDALLIGPGLGRGLLQEKLVIAAVESRKPCVVDADGISTFADSPDSLLEKLHDACVLTPHEGEFARLFGNRVRGSDDKISRTRMAAKIAGCVVLLKGADTIIASPDGRAVINNNAPPWTATAGAGDVLAGLVLGLITQNMPVFEATVAAAWVHGAAATAFGGPGMIAEDLVSSVPGVLKGLSGAPGSV